jgi:nucleoside-triphosphatase THEP1
MRKINILTGPIHSGKTTRLAVWIKSCPNCAGILAPVRDGLRYLYSIHSGQSKLLEAKGNSFEEDDLTRIGEYRFINATFDWAQNELLLVVIQKPEWIIIDEIGPLEMDGKGLEPAVRKILEQMHNQDQLNLLLVVREKLLDLFFQSYDIKETEVTYIQV